MTGKRHLGRLAFSGHRPTAAVWPAVSNEGARRRLNMETDRLLLGDARALPRRPTAVKTHRHRRGEGWTATGQDAASHMRQEYCGNRPN